MRGAKALEDGVDYWELDLQVSKRRHLELGFPISISRVFTLREAGNQMVGVGEKGQGFAFNYVLGTK